MKKTSRHDSATRLKKLLAKRDGCLVPKGEVWMGSAFMESAGLQDTLDNHFRLAEQLGQDMVCLSVSENPEQNADLGYRYFKPCDLSSDLGDRTRFLAAVIDGPFQRMVGRKGLMEVLMSWVRDIDSTKAVYAEEQKIALELIDRCLEKGFDAIILADDLAGDAPFVNPLDLDLVCSPFYSQVVSSIRGAGRFVFFHCCGNLKQLVPLIKSWNFDGLAAIQVGNNDLDLLDSELGGLLIAGIEATLLEKDSVSRAEMDALKQFVARFAGQDRLVLSTSCGLYRSDFWGGVQRLYEELERDISLSL